MRNLGIVLSSSTLIVCAPVLVGAMRFNTLSYNSAAIYAAATNDFNINLTEAGSTNASSLERNSNFTRFSNGQWQAEYLSTTVNFGDLFLLIDDYASYINLTNATNLNVSRDGVPADFKLAGPIEIRLSDIVLNNTNWINATTVASDAQKPTNGKIYARIAAAYGINVPTRSRIQLSWSFLLIVIVCNAVKLSIMLWVLYMEKTDFIVTLGDGAASFIEHPDPTTEKYCVFSKDAIRAEVAHRMSKAEATRSLLSDPSTSEAQFGSAPTVTTGPKADHFEDIVLNSNGMWRDQNHLYSSAIGKDRQVGSSFM